MWKCVNLNEFYQYDNDEIIIMKIMLQKCLIKELPERSS